MEFFCLRPLFFLELEDINVFPQLSDMSLGDMASAFLTGR
jgi:hypothetical protein